MWTVDVHMMKYHLTAWSAVGCSNRFGQRTMEQDLILRQLMMFWPHVLSVPFSFFFSSGYFPHLLETDQCHSNSQRSTVLLCCQLPTDFHNIMLSKVFECLVSVRLKRFMEYSGVLPTTQFAHRKGVGICGSLLSVSHTVQIAVESGQEARVV